MGKDPGLILGALLTECTGCRSNRGALLEARGRLALLSNQFRRRLGLQFGRGSDR